MRLQRDGESQFADANSNGNREDGGGSEVEVAVKRKRGPKKVLLLMSDTGGGHRASAQALEDAFNELYPGQLECDIVDIWSDHAAWPYNQFVPVYKFLAKHPNFWRFFWFYGKMPISRYMQEVMTRRSCFDNFKQCIEASAPDLVVSVHPLCQDIPLRVLQEMGSVGGKRDIPFCTVVTDLGGAHPTWFDKRVDLCFVPSDPIRSMALKLGLRLNQIRQHGLPLRSGFWHAESRSKDEVRRELGLKEGLPTTLVVGGGDGVGGILKIANALGDSLHDHEGCGGQECKQQMVVVCGSNAKAQAKLNAKAEAHAWGPDVEVVSLGYVQNMADYMAAADCLVTKAGPGTIAEAMCRGLPTMLSCYLPGQEAGNVPFVTDGGFGSYSKKPKRIASTVATWMKDPSKLEAMSTTALAAGRPSATYDIARDIAELLFSKGSILQGQTVATSSPAEVSSGGWGSPAAA